MSFKRETLGRPITRGQQKRGVIPNIGRAGHRYFLGTQTGLQAETGEGECGTVRNRGGDNLQGGRNSKDLTSRLEQRGMCDEEGKASSHSPR